MKNLLWAVTVGLSCVALFPPTARAAGAQDGDEPKLVVILSRHGIRTPLLTNDNLGQYSAAPWPTWEVPPSRLTPHGKQQMELMGAYYRSVYVANGLLTGDPAQDGPKVFFRADSDERTVSTAEAIAAGLLPGEPVDVEFRPHNEPDPLFQPVKAGLVKPDPALLTASVVGRMGGNPESVVTACAAQYAVLEKVLWGPSIQVRPARISLEDVPAEITPGVGTNAMEMGGSLRMASNLVDGVLLEFADGKPMSDVGWGRVTPAILTQLLRLQALSFDLTQGSYYVAQQQGSNLASHILKTLEQAASGRLDPGAIAPPAAKMVFLIGHDVNIINLGALLGARWWLPGTQENPVLPGGALVFELRQRRADAQWRVRTYYISQSLKQMRDLQTLTSEHPPEIAPIFIPGCSESGPGFEASLSSIAAIFQRAIDPNSVLPSSR